MSEGEKDATPQDLPAWIDLAPGERVLIHELPDRRARLGSYLATLGLFELWRRRTLLILTDRRLVAVRGLVSRNQQIIPLDKVQEATVRGRTVWVSTVGGALGTQPFGPMGQEQAQRLAEALQRGRPSALKDG